MTERERGEAWAEEKRLERVVAEEGDRWLKHAARAESVERAALAKRAAPAENGPRRDATAVRLVLRAVKLTQKAARAARRAAELAKPARRAAEHAKIMSERAAEAIPEFDLEVELDMLMSDPEAYVPPAFDPIAAADRAALATKSALAELRATMKAEERAVKLAEQAERATERAKLAAEQDELAEYLVEINLLREIAARHLSAAALTRAGEGLLPVFPPRSRW